MSAALVAACLWAVAATVTACLPMRAQYTPGLTLLILAPGLLVWIGWAHGWGWTLAAALAVLSMFRNPLRYFWARARGERPEIPR
ncbi:DUF2484 family protein [Litorisediminicola beolgyonensis]|uniref:DUF2484 family protein n=1 Tax=Litorisediminicola beolgyonensis TaxID=1173614 RepID=A0ABW3ZNY4_9RHOB